MADWNEMKNMAYNLLAGKGAGAEEIYAKADELYALCTDFPDLLSHLRYTYNADAHKSPDFHDFRTVALKGYQRSIEVTGRPVPAKLVTEVNKPRPTPPDRGPAPSTDPSPKKPTKGKVARKRTK